MLAVQESVKRGRGRPPLPATPTALDAAPFTDLALGFASRYAKWRHQAFIGREADFEDFCADLREAAWTETLSVCRRAPELTGDPIHYVASGLKRRLMGNGQGGRFHDLFLRHLFAAGYHGRRNGTVAERQAERDRLVADLDRLRPQLKQARENFRRAASEFADIDQQWAAVYGRLTELGGPRNYTDDTGSISDYYSLKTRREVRLNDYHARRCSLGGGRPRSGTLA